MKEKEFVKIGASEYIKSCADVLDVAGELEKMKKEYEKNDYDCELLLCCLKIKFNDGFVMIVWRDGAFYEDYYKYKS